VTALVHRSPGVHFERDTGKSSAFANRAVVVQSWYPAVRSRAVRRGRVRSYRLLNRRIAIYRDFSGRVYALDARCPHLGADLGRGTVEGDALRCAFHRWCFGPDGRCRNAPGQRDLPERQLRVYPVEERWGFVWLFNGPSPSFGLPEAPAGTRWWSLSLPAQRIACHPHVVLGNGLDLSHYETLHGFAFTEAPRLTLDPPYQVTVDLRGRARSRFARLLSGAARRDLVARFTTIGGSLAWTDVFAPVRFCVLFTGQPDPLGRCVTRTFLFFPKGTFVNVLRAFGLMAALLHDDRRILDGLEFAPHFTDRDAPLRAYAELVNGLDTW
jgi:phenylpropionate dioxygenase-like ring-hydroxylating dioxygenase large terminal subunit